MFRKMTLFALLALVAVTFSITPRPAHATPNAAYIVNSTQDTNDGLCNAANCTLREAINAANASEGLDFIHFNMSPCNFCAITPATALPEIADPVVLDGFTQPGASPNTSDTFAFDAVYKVGLFGGYAPDGANGLNLSAGDSVVKGLVIANFPKAGIRLHGAGRSIISGNFIGVAPGGLLASPNERGILIDGGSSRNMIGGIDYASRNLISGNTVAGIEIDYVGGSANANVIVGNIIGLNSKLNSALGNGTGIILRTKKNKVGMPGELGPNLIGGNLGNGLEISGGKAKRNTVDANLIGGYPDGLPGNGLNGVTISAGARKNKIGTPALGNTILLNGADGIAILDASSKANALRRNFIGWNGELGIDLGDDGVTANDADDGDIGPNGFQNFPIIKSANATLDRVKLRFEGAPHTTYTIELFVTYSECDTSGYGEGVPIHTVNVTTNAAGKASLTVITDRDFEPGYFITATATDPKGNTSEFSQCRLALLGA